MKFFRESRVAGGPPPPPTGDTENRFYLRNAKPFHHYNNKRRSQVLPISSGAGQQAFWHNRIHDKSFSPIAGNSAIFMNGTATHFIGNVCTIFASYPITILAAQTIPIQQITIGYAGYVNWNRLNIRIAPVLGVYRPKTNTVVGYLYDNTVALGNPLPQDTSTGRVVTFNTQNSVIAELGDILFIDWMFIGSLANHSFGNGLVKGGGQGGTSIVTDGWNPNTLFAKAGDAWSETDDESFRHDYRVAANTTSDGTGNATIPLTTGLSTTAKPSDNNPVYLHAGFFVGYEGSQLPVEGVANSNPSTYVEFATPIFRPSINTPAFFEFEPSRPGAMSYVGGLNIDASYYRVYDRDGANITGSHSLGLASGDSGIASISGTNIVPVSAGLTTVTATAGGLQRFAQILIEASKFATSIVGAANHYLERDFASIATDTTPPQAAPDTMSRGSEMVALGSQAYDDAEWKYFKTNQLAPGFSRVDTNGVVGGASGVIDGIRIAHSSPIPSVNGKSVHRHRYFGAIAGTSPGTMQAGTIVHNGKQLISNLGWNEVEFYEAIYLSHEFLVHNILTKYRFYYFIDSYKRWNLVFGLQPMGVNVSNSKSIDWNGGENWRIGFRGQSHPEDSSLTDPGAVVRANYNSAFAPKLDQWNIFRNYFHMGTVGNNDGIIRMDVHDGSGWTNIMNITNVRLKRAINPTTGGAATNHRVGEWQSAAVWGGGRGPVLREPMDHYIDHVEIRGR